jgi:carboxylesterase type B
MQMMLPMFFRGVNKKDPVAVRNRLLELISDGMFVCPDMLLVNAYAKKGTVWYYRFDYRPSKSYWNSWMLGSLHMDDHQFVWGIPFREDAKENYSDKDREISKIVMTIWSEFIKTGNPALEKKWKWKPTNKKSKGYVTITAKGPKGSTDFPKNSCKDLTRYYSMGRSFLKNYKPS